MNQSIILSTFICVSIAFPLVATATDVGEEEINKKIESLEQRLQQVESDNAEAVSVQAPASQQGNNAFNPSVSVILDGALVSYKNNPENYTLPGFAAGGDFGLASEGFSLGESEITLSNNIDDKFYGQLTLAFADAGGQTEVGVEEAFFETLALDNGFTLRGGRFKSALGYLNQQHAHAWDFYDIPLVYQGLFGGQYADDGLRLSYIVPTDMFVELGAEVFSGSKYPAGGNHSGVGSWTAFANLGGDIDDSQSWQAGVSYWQADSIERAYNDIGVLPSFSGDSNIVGLNAVYKWAPDGNYREENLKFQFEYFRRDDNGELTLLDNSSLQTSSLDSQQSGWYAQAIWQFMPTWSAGVRYDRLESDNSGSDLAVLGSAGLISDGHTPTRSSVMAQWLPSEFSRIRLQFNRDESYQVADNQMFLQYTFSIGAHGAHQY